ncbi:MAG: D-tyrosyl-tRNA(Tyr) deacylase [Simkaniaceae bacterium]|nr:D-tyrosyl-tRNA(Tyr) deacylase [Simkaniaceae bacterium]
MRALIQRVKQAGVTVNGKVVGEIKKGLLIFLGVTHDDTMELMHKMADKIIGLRIFEDQNQKMNLSIEDIRGEILVVSQFTLYGDCAKGRRPSFAEAAEPKRAKILYDFFIKELRFKGIKTQEGVFGAYMDVALINDGPATFLIELSRSEIAHAMKGGLSVKR